MDLSQLNPGQRAAASAPNGAHLIIAGAGTGKTRTLVHRVAWLIEQGVMPERIVLLTFSRRAAGEMLERVARLKGSMAHRVRGGTFHAFAVRQLRRYSKALGYANHFTILDRGDAEELMGQVRRSLGLGGTKARFPKRSTLLKIHSKRLNTRKQLSEIVEQEFPQYADHLHDLARVFDHYNQRKKAEALMDFDDLLVRFAELLADHAEIRHQISSECEHILVDEYQDTNPLQAQIACYLSVIHGNLTVVGDDAQSIYAFRGASVDNIFDFPRLFPGCEPIYLEQSYRSTQPVLDFANGVLKSATRSYEKRLFSELPGDDKPLRVLPYNEQEQADFICKEIVKLRKIGTPSGEIAVLFRSGYHSNLLEIALGGSGIAFRKYGGIRFVDASHIKDLFALLRLFANPADSVAWKRVLTWGEGLGAKGAEQIITRVQAHPTLRLDPSAFKRRKYYGFLVDLARLFDQGRETDELTELVSLVTESYKKQLIRLYDDAASRERDLSTLELLANQHEDLEGFLTEVSLDPPEPAQRPKEHDTETITLSTIHSSKGLEWEAVFVLQLADGHFPSGYSLDNDEAIEEERRLFYVAVTRAKTHLYLLCPQNLRARWGSASSPGCLLTDSIPGLRRLTRVPKQKVAEVQAPKSRDLSAAEDRMAAFLDHFGKKNKGR